MLLRAILVAMGLGAALAGPCLAGDEADALRRLTDAYASPPQGYPAGAGCAQPDPSVPFRWHRYHDGAIDRFEGVKMARVTGPYNSLDDAGATPGAGVKAAFVAEHATAGAKALRVDAPADVVRAGKASVEIAAVEGPELRPIMYAPKQGFYHGTHWPSWRFLAFDVFNPSDAPVGIRVGPVPMVVGPGASVVRVKTADLSGMAGAYVAIHTRFSVRLAGPEKDLTLYLDNVRMEQEAPEGIAARGRLLQFPWPVKEGKAADAKAYAPALQPGFQPVYDDTLYDEKTGLGWTEPAKTRRLAGGTRGQEPGLLWGMLTDTDAPLRVDLPNGRYVVVLFAAPNKNFNWKTGAVAKLNGAEGVFIEPKDDAAVRAMALGGEAWDYRPGDCLWESLVRPAFYPPTTPLTAEVTDGALRIELPRGVWYYGLAIFPEAVKDQAMGELGRLNFLIAEGWDAAHPWIKPEYIRGDGALRPYVGMHEEMLRPEVIGQRLAALKLTDADFARGFVPFGRHLLDPVYADSIPTPEELAARELVVQVVPGQRTCVAMGLLPLREASGLKVTATGLKSASGELPPAQMDVRVSRLRHMTQMFSHGNHAYNLGEGFLVVRESLDLYPGAARRVYVQVHVPPETPAGTYTGRIAVTSADGQSLSETAIRLEVAAVKLDEPATCFAGGDYSSEAGLPPMLLEYGLNTFYLRPDAAVAMGCKAYVARLAHFKPELLEAARAGKAPSPWFGTDPWYNKLPPEELAKMAEDNPGLRIFGVNVPVLTFLGPPEKQHEWTALTGNYRQTFKNPALLEEVAAGGKPFWFIDGLRYGKEHAARFTYGLWLWRSGAAGRYTSLGGTQEFRTGHAGDSYPHLPYYNLLLSMGMNFDRAWADSRTAGRLNPSRDLVLLREGINDYACLYTLDRRLEAAAKAGLTSPALQKAQAFRKALWESVSLDLRECYQPVGGAYSEVWFLRDGQPWPAQRLDEVRCDALAHLQALGGAGP